MKIKKYEIYFYLLGLIFLEAIEIYFKPIKYLDELIVLIFALRYFEMKIRKNAFKLSTEEKKYLCLIFGLIVIGIISNLIYKLQNIQGVFVDIISCTKVYLFYIFIKNFEYDSRENLNLIYKIIQYLLYIVLILGFINIFFDIGMRYDRRYFLSSYKFIFYNPGNLNVMMIVFIALMTLEYEKNKKSILVANIINIMTLRGVGLAMVAIYYFLTYINKKRIKIVFKSILCITAITIISFPSLKKYFLDSTTARSVLLKKSFTVAKDFFPLGAGFGTYGSDVSKKSYSKLYYEYGINDIYGLSEKHGSFITDNYWPMIIGQFGFFSIFIILGLHILFYKMIKPKFNKYNTIPITYLLLYLIIGSIAAQPLAHSIGITVVLTIFICLNYDVNENKKYIRGDK